jgi:hypothetical protein
MTEPLFTVGTADYNRILQACDLCIARAHASDDELRVRGWQVYDGTSFTGKPLNVRICPACRDAACDARDAARY